MLRKVLATATAVASLTPQLSHALGLGQVTLKSALNEPLEAEIRLVDADDLQSGDFVVRLASERAFNLSQIPRDPFLTRLNFEIDEERGVVIVTSQAPVREPYLSLLVEASWSSGRVLREYTLLLDLPSLSDETVSAPVQTARTAPVAETVVPTPQQDPVTIPASRPNVAERETRATEQAQNNGEYFVRSGDTLWSIAKALRPASDVTIQQMILALRAANPDAFLNGDINRLMRGSTLSIPTADDARAYNQFEARDAVANGVSSTGSLSSLGTEGTLVVSSGSDDSGTVELEEAVDGLKNENDQLRTRIDELETENETMGELIELRSEELSRLQDSVTTEPETPQVETEVVDSVGTPDTGTSNDIDSSLGANETESPVETAEPATTADATEAAPTEAAPVRPRGPVVAQTNSITPWYLEPIYQAAAGGIALLGLLFFWWRRRQQKDDENDQLNQAFAPVADSEKIGAGSSSVADILADARREDFDDGEVDLEVDEAQLESTMVDYLESEDNSFDEELNLESPVAAADGYIAFDQFDRARHILEQALERDETDDQARLKLLEVLAAQKDVRAFNEQADYFNLSDDASIEAQIDALRSALPAEEMAETSTDDVNEEAAADDDDFASVDLDDFDIESTPVSTAFGESDDNDETSFEDFDLSEFETTDADASESADEVTEVDLSESDDLNDFDFGESDDDESELKSFDDEVLEIEASDELSDVLEDDEASTLAEAEVDTDDVVLTDEDLSLDVNALIGSEANDTASDDDTTEISSLDDETLDHIHTISPEYDDFDFEAELDNAVQSEQSDTSLEEQSDDSTSLEIELDDSELELSEGTLESDTVELIEDAETEEVDRFEVDFSLDDATVPEALSTEEVEQDLDNEATDDDLGIDFNTDGLSLVANDDALEVAEPELSVDDDDELTLDSASAETTVEQTESDDDAWTTDDEYHTGLDDSFDDLSDLSGSNDTDKTVNEDVSSSVDLDAELESLEDFDVESLENDFEASFGDDLADIDSELAVDELTDSTDDTVEDATPAGDDAKPETSVSGSIFDTNASSSSSEFEAFESEISELNESFGEAEISSASEQSFDSSDDENDDNADLALIDGAEELSTKLDLARAFIDMDDVEGALELLDEVISDATDESLIAEAKQLKDSL